MEVWIFFSGALTAQNSQELNIHFKDSCIQWYVLYLNLSISHNLLETILDSVNVLNPFFQDRSSQYIIKN